jgi:hypothetical protein
VLTQFALDLVPNPVDWAWIPYAPNLTALNSYLIVGDFNTSDYIPAGATTLAMNSVSNSTWLFNLTQFGFGITNTTLGLDNATEYYTNMTNATYN